MQAQLNARFEGFEESIAKRVSGLEALLYDVLDRLSGTRLLYILLSTLQLILPSL